MSDDSIIERSSGLALEKTHDARFELRVERDQIAACGWAFLWIVMAVPTIGFAILSLYGFAKLIAADDLRMAVAALVFCGGMAWGCGVAVWLSHREAAFRFHGRIFEIDPDRQVLTMRQGRQVQQFPFSEITAVNLETWFSQAGLVFCLSFAVRKPREQLVIQILRLNRYRLKGRLDDLASLGQRVAEIVGASFSRPKGSPPEPVAWSESL